VEGVEKVVFVLIEFDEFIVGVDVLLETEIMFEVGFEFEDVVFAELLLV
jgi:hypothetical protein